MQMVCSQDESSGTIGTELCSVDQFEQTSALFIPLYFSFSWERGCLEFVSTGGSKPFLILACPCGCIAGMMLVTDFRRTLHRTNRQHDETIGRLSDCAQFLDRGVGRSPELSVDVLEPGVPLQVPRELGPV